jgi:predicted nucleic acid-binding protein
MMLLDTNLLIYASDKQSPHYKWARRTIADAVAGEGAAINAVSLAEVCVGDAEPQRVADRATADQDRFRIYFPKVSLKTP